MIAASRSGGISCAPGMPPTDEQLGSGTIVSPCPPSSIARTSSTLTPSSRAMNARNRAVSSTPAWPSTRRGGKPVACNARCTIASSGLLTTMTIASGLVPLTCSATAATIRRVGGQEVVAAHARLPRHARGDHHDVAVGRGVVAGRADDHRVEAGDGRRLEEVEGLCLGHVFRLRDVQEDNVAQFRGGAPMRRGCADVARPDDREFARFMGCPFAWEVVFVGL